MATLARFVSRPIVSRVLGAGVALVGAFAPLAFTAGATVVFSFFALAVHSSSNRRSNVRTLTAPVAPPAEATIVLSVTTSEKSLKALAPGACFPTNGSQAQGASDANSLDTLDFVLLLWSAAYKSLVGVASPPPSPPGVLGVNPLAATIPPPCIFPPPFATIGVVVARVVVVVVVVINLPSPVNNFPRDALGIAAMLSAMAAANCCRSVNRDILRSFVRLKSLAVRTVDARSAVVVVGAPSVSKEFEIDVPTTTSLSLNDDEL
jgi:hypothetical protein